MQDYNPSALRILLTKQHRESDSRLIPYNPEEKSGPWWLDSVSGQHYRNGHYTLEFMIEDEIGVAEADSISFGKHHEWFCCIDPSTCADKNMDYRRAAGIFGAGGAINGIRCEALPISEDSCGAVIDTLNGFYHWSRDKEFAGRESSSAMEHALANAWLSACYFRRPDEQRAIILLFESRDKFFGAVASVLVETFGEKMHNLIYPK